MNELPDKIPFKEQKGNMKILGIRVGENENVIRNLIWEKVLKGMSFSIFSVSPSKMFIHSFGIISFTFSY